MNNPTPLTDSSNDELEIQLFLKAAHEFLNLVSETYSQSGLPIKTKTIQKIEGNDVSQVEEEFISEWFFRDIPDLGGSFHDLKCAKAYLKYMIDNKVVEFSKISNNAGEELKLDVDERVNKGSFDWEWLVIYPVIDILKANKSLSVSDDDLAKSYERYIQLRKTPIITEIINTPLLGFGSNVDVFIFSDEFSICPFSDFHKNEYNKLTDFSNGCTTNEICEATHIIRFETTYPRGEKSDFDHENCLYLLLMSLRLCTSADIIAKFSYKEPNKTISMIGGGGKWHFETSKPMNFNEPHQFSQKNLEQVKTVHSELLNIKNNAGYKNIFNVVVIRYLSSLSKTSPEDSIIDLTICLEALLLANERDELKFRLALRGAVLLVDEEPKQTKKSLSAMYDDRSKIVHGGKRLQDIRETNSRETLKTYRQLTEKIILAYISKSEIFDSIKDINQHIDNLCLMAGKAKN